MSLATVPVVSGGEGERGHLEEFRTGTAAWGPAFATMQIKAIFSVLLRAYEFEMAQPADTYRNDHSKMVVQLERPAKVRYRRRQGPRT